MADPPSDFIENLGIGSSLQPDAVSDFAAKTVDRGGAQLAEITHTLSSRVASRHWVGKLGDKTRDELEGLARVGKNAGEEVQEYAKTFRARSESAVTAQSVCQQNSQCTPGVSPMAQTKAVARALQNHYGEPGEQPLSDLQYPGRAPGEQTQDRGESPDGPSQVQHSPSSGGGGSPAAGGGAAAGGASPAQDAAARAADTGKPEAATGGQPAGDGQGSGAGSGGGGSPSGGGGEGSGAGGGSPSGGSPASGSPGSGSGFDPAAGETSAMSADTLPGSVSGGVGGGLGGVGGLGGGDHERALSGKSGAAGARPGLPTVNVNTPGGTGAGPGMMGGGMGGGAHGGKPEEKEHKTAAYLSSTDNGYELIGGNLPVATPEVIGELTKQEYKAMQEQRAEQQGQQPGAGAGA